MQAKNVDFFLARINRLKSALGVSKDKEVAEFLGISDKAFNARKARNSFPEAELIQLCERRPDLNLNFEYILDGTPIEEKQQQFIDRMQGINQMAVLVDAMAISDLSKTRLKVCLTGDHRSDALAIAEGLKSEDVQALPVAANDYVYVPRYDVQASAGNGAVIHDESIVDHLAFKREWITRNLGLDPQRLALIDVAGDSMAPTIGDGDLILIDTRPTPVKSEGVYVINLSGALLVKRLRMRLSGVVDVVSDNAHYGTETISGEQLAQLAVLGRVVWQGRRV